MSSEKSPRSIIEKCKYLWTKYEKNLIFLGNKLKKHKSPQFPKNGDKVPWQIARAAVGSVLFAGYYTEEMK